MNHENAVTISLEILKELEGVLMGSTLPRLEPLRMRFFLPGIFLSPGQAGRS